jgi:hypothetical protein
MRKFGQAELGQRVAEHELFQSFWFGDALSPHHWLCLKSFIDHGHAFRLYSYEQIVVPWGVECADAREILPRERVFFYPRDPGAGGVAGFANLFRYKLLLEHGGWWVDTDVVCRARDVSDAALSFAWEEPGLIGNAVLKMPRGHPLAWRLFAAADCAGSDLDWGATGPYLLTRLVEGSDYARHVLPNAFCYPLPAADATKLLDPGQCADVERAASDSRLIHLWNEMWRRNGVDYFRPPAAGSFMAKLYFAHRLDFGQVAKVIRFDSLTAETARLCDQLRDAEAAQAMIAEESAASRANFDRAVDSLRSRADELRTAWDALALRYNEMACSTSWRISAPVRIVGRRLPGIAHLCRLMLRRVWQVACRLAGEHRARRPGAPVSPRFPQRGARQAYGDTAD